MDTGKCVSIFAPLEYMVLRGPGTLETTTLIGSGMLAVIPVASAKRDIAAIAAGIPHVAKSGPLAGAKSATKPFACSAASRMASKRNIGSRIVVSKLTCIIVT